MSRKEWTFLQYITWKSMTSQKLCTFSFLARFLLIFLNSVQIWIIFHIFLLSCYMFFLFLTFLTQHAILGVTSPENNISLSTLATKAKNINFFLTKCVILIIPFLRGCCIGKLNNVYTSDIFSQTSTTGWCSCDGRNIFVCLESTVKSVKSTLLASAHLSDGYLWLLLVQGYH